MNKRSIAALAAMVLLASLPAAAQEQAGRKLSLGVVTGGGYTAFDAGGSPGENIYWVSAVAGPGQLDKGLWYADVFIDFPTNDFDFEALYRVDCVNVKRSTGEAWVDGTVIESNNPARLGVRATLYIKDGGPDGPNQHGITPLAASAPRNNCDSRPEPNFRETAQQGRYIVR